MSVKAAKEYFKKLRSNKAFRAKITAAKDNAARLKVAKEAGLDFTAGDIKKAHAEIFKAVKAKTQGKSLSDKQLQAIAGGAQAQPGAEHAEYAEVAEAVDMVDAV